MILMLSEGGLELRSERNKFYVDEMEFNNLDLAIDCFMSSIQANERIVIDNIGGV